MLLSKHFSLAEFTRSQTAARRGIDNTPDPLSIERMKELCENVLEPLREAVGAPIFVSSGYRCAKLNNAIGGAPSSQHILGQAADIQVPGWTPRKVCDWIYENVDFDQVIEEYGQWTHVSYRGDSINRKNYLDAVRGKGYVTVK